MAASRVLDVPSGRGKAGGLRTLFFVELSSLLSNRMDKVLEDYDPSRCQDLYSDDSGSVVSTRSDAVSM